MQHWTRKNLKKKKPAKGKGKMGKELKKTDKVDDKVKKVTPEKSKLKKRSNELEKGVNKTPQVKTTTKKRAKEPHMMISLRPRMIYPKKKTEVGIKGTYQKTYLKKKLLKRLRFFNLQLFIEQIH
jgi:hypothetical protein